MYNLIIEKKTLGQKGLTVANYLKENYKNDFIVSNSLKTNCKRNIILSQFPIQYKTGLINEYLNGIHFIRPEFIKNSNLNYSTNCFSIFNENEKYKFFIPMLYEYKKESISNKEINVGYYYTTYRNTINEFLEFIKNNINKVKFITLLNGNPLLISKLLNINNQFIIENTLNKDYFFSKITHIITIMSKKFIDPWPTVLEEAVRCNKQIIILKQNRNWKDGIDDICSCISYHENLNDLIYDNSKCSINKFDLKEYYNYLIQSNFEYLISRKTYKNFNSFLFNFKI